jgi:hypothetical protein
VRLFQVNLLITISFDLLDSLMKISEDPVFGTMYYLCFFFFFRWESMVPNAAKKIWKIFWPQKRGFSPGLNTQKFFNFSLILGDFVP